MNCLRRPWLGLVFLAAFSVPSPSFADDPTDADRAGIAALGRDIVARLDAAEEARAARTVADEAAQRAKDALGEAERTRMIAEISVKEYLEGSYPQDRQTLMGEIKLAESELARATDRLAWVEKPEMKDKVSESQVLADRMSKQKAEISLMNANTKMKVLETYAKIKTITELEAKCRNAKAVEASKERLWEAAKTALERADRRLLDEGISERESEAIVGLDGALNLFDDGKVDAARIKLVEAKHLWEDAQAARAKARFARVKDRVRAEAKKARGGR